MGQVNYLGVDGMLLCLEQICTLHPESLITFIFPCKSSLTSKPSFIQVKCQAAQIEGSPLLFVKRYCSATYELSLATTDNDS